jgi:hypothetical protein
MEIDRRAFMASLGGAATSVPLVNFHAGRGAIEANSLAQGAGLRGFNPQAIGDRANADAEFTLLARYWDGRLRLEMGDQFYEVVLREGRIAEFRRAASSDQADVKLAGPVQTWTGGFGFHGLTLTGDNVGHVWPYYGAIYRLVALVREALSGPAREAMIPDVDRQFDTAVGRYVYVRIQGVQYRVYYEEAGKGVPILLQHTAGADGREWRFMLEDTELQKKFRMIAYDLPYHGRSLPPMSVLAFSP